MREYKTHLQKETYSGQVICLQVGRKNAIYLQTYDNQYRLRHQEGKAFDDETLVGKHISVEGNLFGYALFVISWEEINK